MVAAVMATLVKVSPSLQHNNEVSFGGFHSDGALRQPSAGVDDSSEAPAVTKAAENTSAQENGSQSELNRLATSLRLSGFVAIRTA